MTFNSTLFYQSMQDNGECNDSSSLPSRSPEPHLRYHFTKTEEREIKKANRRIKNKLSAQESRKRKKEYIEGLERKMRQKDRDNLDLQSRVNFLEQRVTHLTNEMRGQSSSQDTTTNRRPSTEESRTKFPVCVRHISRSTQTGVCLDCFSGYTDPLNRSPIRKPIERHSLSDQMLSNNHHGSRIITTLENRQVRPKSLDLKKQSFNWSSTASSGSNES